MRFRCIHKLGAGSWCGRTHPWGTELWESIDGAIWHVVAEARDGVDGLVCADCLRAVAAAANRGIAEVEALRADVLAVARRVQTKHEERRHG